MAGKWIMQIGEQQYPLASFMDLPLSDLDAFEDATGWTVADVETIWESDGNLALSKDGRRAIAVRAWVCRRAAGEDVTIEQAVAGVPLRDLFVAWDGPDPLPVTPDPTPAEEAADPDDSTD